mmetsp:Transcript_67755/g.102164  ORF Transcript_67755/g.102164 Transcript_67755/m.102164 type:complete len:376 (-) Transcript_67755:66-1193(-)
MSSLLSKGAVIGDLNVKNRVVMAPLTRSRAGEFGIPNQLMAKYYTQRSGAGLIITEATNISDIARGWNGAPGIYTQEMIDAWKSLTNTVKKGDTIFFMQLWHTGRASHSSFHKNGEKPVAASAVVLNGEYIHTPIGKQPYETPEELSVENIKKTVEDYRKAAANAKAAGFDGVEIHAANGYLIDTFLQSKTNKRTDNYGGSFENRFRFLKEIIEAISLELDSTRIGVRLSPNGVFNDMGSPDYMEAFSYYLRELNKFKLGYVHVMDGLGFGFHKLGEPFTLDIVRKNYMGTVISNCGHSIEDGESIISSGKADLLAFGRPFISNPDLVERIRKKYPLTEYNNSEHWYSGGEVGYTDYPTLNELSDCSESNEVSSK